MNLIKIDLDTLRPTALADLCAMLTAEATEDREYGEGATDKIVLAQTVEIALINLVGIEDAVEALALAGAHPEILEMNVILL